MGCPREQKIDDLREHHPMFIVLRPEVSDRELMSPYSVEQRRLGYPLVVERDVHPVAEDQEEDGQRRATRQHREGVRRPAVPGHMPPRHRYTADDAADRG